MIVVGVKGSRHKHLAESTDHSTVCEYQHEGHANIQQKRKPKCPRCVRHVPAKEWPK